MDLFTIINTENIRSLVSSFSARVLLKVRLHCTAVFRGPDGTFPVKRIKNCAVIDLMSSQRELVRLSALTNT